MADFSDDESEPEMAADAEENVSDLDEVVEEILNNDNRGEALMDPADIEVQFDLEIEPVSMENDPYAHSAMPSLANATSFIKVPNVAIVGEQIPAPRRTRMYGNATKPVAELIPSHVYEDKQLLFKYMYDNADNGEESLVDLIIVASNIRMKKIYPDRPKGNDSYDIYYVPITKKDFYSYLSLSSMMSGWRGPRQSQRKFYRQLQSDSRVKDCDLMPLRRYEVIHNSLDIGVNQMVNLLVNGQPKISSRSGRPVQVLDLKTKYEKPFEVLNNVSNRYNVSKDGIYAIDERLSKSYLQSPTKGNFAISAKH